ncbi:Ubiquitin carboxyl-terminal hydrolase family protein [Striga hermonthica]|uniref:Ubiquitin carboxyl-terminal hydrolase family protein n=1 Tax=Striga hermonthica TaxID=68872 RepID=A0A9N7NLX4_STRHE|nr:Ubiquitin carboxyl-terminal hydrolase family protein [Striga hermonthica]
MKDVLKVLDILPMRKALTHLTLSQSHKPNGANEVLEKWVPSPQGPRERGRKPSSWSPTNSGLPEDFKNSIIVKYPHVFKLDKVDEMEHMCLGNWDSSLAVTAREEKLASITLSGPSRRAKVPRDENFSDPFAFRLNFSTGFRPNESYLLARLLLCLRKHQVSFYITNKGARSSVFLKEAYEGSDLVDKCPLLEFRDKFMGLMVWLKSYFHWFDYLDSGSSTNLFDGLFDDGSSPL